MSRYFLPPPPPLPSPFPPFYSHPRTIFASVSPPSKLTRHPSCPLNCTPPCVHARSHERSRRGVCTCEHRLGRKGQSRLSHLILYRPHTNSLEKSLYLHHNRTKKTHPPPKKKPPPFRSFIFVAQLTPKYKKPKNLSPCTTAPCLANPSMHPHIPPFFLSRSCIRPSFCTFSRRREKSICRRRPQSSPFPFVLV